MLTSGHLDAAGELIFIGPETERRYGYRHFMELLSIFTSAPQITVLHGRREVGAVDPFVLIRKVTGQRVIALAGRGWMVTAIDWSRRRAHVGPAEGRGLARWINVAQPQSYEFVDAQRRVLLGAEPYAARLSNRAREHLPVVCEEWAGRIDNDHSLVVTEDSRTHWWTWAGGRANAVLTAALETADPTLVDDDYVFDNRQIGPRASVSGADLRRAIHEVQARFDDLGALRPFVSERALQELEFAELLPSAMARATLEERIGDSRGAAEVAARPIATSV